MPEAIPVYGISDLHLFIEGGSGRLPGGLSYQAIPPGLSGHWHDQVEGRAWVLVPGDISDSSPEGGMQSDYDFLDKLPGQKLLSPGNHDYGPWRSSARIEGFCRRFSSLTPLASGHATRLAQDPKAAGLVVAALMGACTPGDAWFGGEINMLGPDNPRLRFRVELANLKVALAEAQRLRRWKDRFLVQIHYPPFVDLTRPGPFSRLIERSGADLCIYGHLHQESESGFEGNREGVEYRIVAAPRLGMRPLELGELTETGFRSQLLGD